MPTKKKKTMPTTKNSRNNKKPTSMLHRFAAMSQRTQFLIFLAVFAVLGGAYLTFSSSAATVNCSRILISPQTKGQDHCVSTLQKVLTAYGYNTGTTNGDFGSQTREAIQKFKADFLGVKNPEPTVDAAVVENLCGGGAVGAASEYCGETSQVRSRLTNLVSGIRETIQNPGPNTVVNSNTQITNTGGKIDIGNQSTTVTNTNTQTTNTGGQSQVGNNTNNNTSNTKQNTAPTPAPVDPAAEAARKAAQDAAKQAALRAVMQQIASMPQGTTVTNTNTQVTNTGGKVNIGNTSTTISNVNTSYQNTGGQIIVGNNGSGCNTVTMNDPFTGVAKTYTSCNTQTAVSKGPAISIPPTAPTTPVQSNPAALSNYQCPGRTTVQTGSKGDCVKRVQDILNIRIGAGIAVDGDFGPKTKQAVINYQQRHGLSADGIVGNQTWSSLEGDTTIAPVGTNAPAPTSPRLPTGTQTPKKPSSPVNNQPSRPNVDTKTGTSQELAAPSSSYKRNSDTHVFTYDSKGSKLRSVYICVSIGPTVSGQSMPREITTTSGEKIALSRDDRRNTYTGCTKDGFSRDLTRATYRVNKTGYWVAVYGSKLN